MSFCGYNKTMAEGLQIFGKGLAVQTNKRASEEGVPLTGVPAIELAELDIMIESLKGSPRQAELEGILGLTLFVRYIYRQIAVLQQRWPEISAEDALQRIVGQTNTALFAMEDDYYANLRPNYPRAEAIARMIKFLESKVGIIPIF